MDRYRVREKIMFFLITQLLNSVPKDYQEEAKYCFYQLTTAANRTLKLAFGYFLGGIEYRLKDLCDFFFRLILKVNKQMETFYSFVASIKILASETNEVSMSRICRATKLRNMLN